MRILHTFNNEKDARIFSSFLFDKKIKNQIEIFRNRDWSSDKYGDMACNIWIIEEDDFLQAEEYLRSFLRDPEAPEFSNAVPSPLPHYSPPPEPQRIRKRNQRANVITLYTIIACVIIFFLSISETKISRLPPPDLVPATPLYSSSIKKALFYDYPRNFEIIDKLVKAYGISALYEPQKLPLEGRYLFKKYLSTPYWRGLYDKIVMRLKNPPKPISFDAPMFEKIKKGELWRLITPIFLHHDILHIFFNMIWLLVIGQQIESRVGALRYIIFILISAAVSNTAQYLMTGSSFLGFSGVLCAMIAFVWFRQKRAPWEGYMLLPSTMAFITIFVLVLAAIQTVSFLMEINNLNPIAPPIANTAHLTGGIMGFLLSRSRYFRWQK